MPLTAVTALKALDAEFESVSASLKVPFFKTFWRVTRPICTPTLLEVARYSFINAMTTISAVVFLYSPDTKVAAIAILPRRSGRGRAGGGVRGAHHGGVYSRDLAVHGAGRVGGRAHPSLAPHHFTIGHTTETLPVCPSINRQECTAFISSLLSSLHAG